MIRSWKVPVALFVAGVLLQALVSVLVGDTVGNWVGGTLGVAAVVTAIAYARTRAHAGDADSSGT